MLRSYPDKALMEGVKMREVEQSMIPKQDVVIGNKEDSYTDQANSTTPNLLRLVVLI